MKKFLTLIVPVLVLIPTCTSAAVFGSGDSYSLGSDATVSDNLYAGAGDLSLAGTVSGDAYAAGGSVVVSGDIRDDLVAAGGNVTVLGDVGGDARAAGGNIVLSGDVGGDLVLAGGSVKVLGGTKIGKDVAIAGGTVTFAGEAAGNAHFAGSHVVIEGKIAGDVVVDADKKIILADGAEIGGSLVYRGARENILDMNEGAKVGGGVRFEEHILFPSRKELTWGILAVFGVFFATKLVMTLIASVLLVLLFTKISQELVDDALVGFGGNLLRGIIVFILVPLAIIGLFMTFIGIFAGILLLLAYLFFVLASSLYGGVIFGYAIHRMIRKNQPVALAWWHPLVGVTLLSLILLVPFVGWIMSALFFVLALGAISNIFYRRVWLRR